jgi:hypothetical protein
MPIDVYVDTEKWKAGRYPILLWILLVLGLLAGLIFLGKSLTPEGNKILSWPEWQILLAHRAYEKELAQFQQDIGILADLVNQPPDPVRAQVVCDKISAQTQDGQPALAVPREALSNASNAIEQWAVGAATQDDALTALQAAIQAIKVASSPSQVSP